MAPVTTARTRRTILGSVGTGLVGGCLQSGQRSIYDRLVETSSVDETTTEVWRTPGFADYPWAVNVSLDEGTVSRISDAFVSLDEKGRDAILGQQNVDKYVTTDHEDFEALGDAVRMMGLLNDDND